MAKHLGTPIASGKYKGRGRAESQFACERDVALYPALIPFKFTGYFPGKVVLLARDMSSLDFPPEGKPRTYEWKGAFVSEAELASLPMMEWSDDRVAPDGSNGDVRRWLLPLGGFVLVAAGIAVATRGRKIRRD